MAIGRVNSVAHNFGHHFLWYRRGAVYSHLVRKAKSEEIASIKIDLFEKSISPSSMNTPVFQHVISDLQGIFFRCLDSVAVDHDYVTGAEICFESNDFPARRCKCIIHDRYGHTYAKEVEIENKPICA